MSTTEQLSPDQLRKRIRENEQRIERLEKAPDPGAGKAPEEAQALRSADIAELEVAHHELLALRAEWAATAPEVVERRSQLDRIRWLGRKHVARELHSAEDNAMIRESSQALAARQREREARERLQALKAKRLHPPHPDAAELVAAVMAEPSLFESMEVKLRGDEETGYVNTHTLEALEVGVLVVCLHLLREQNPIVISGFATSARWPKRTPLLVPVDGLRQALVELRREGWLAFTVEGDTAAVSYGPHVFEVATSWGISLEEAATSS